MDFEHELEGKAYDLVGEGSSLVDALEAVEKDHDLRHSYFTTPYQIEVAEARPFQNSGGGKGAWNANASANAIKDAFETSQKGKVKGKGKDKGKKDGKGSGKKRSRTEDGRQICFAHNKGEQCDGKCGRVHICQICGEDHPLLEHHELKKRPQ